MKTRFRQPAILFAVVQTIGLVCMFTWQAAPPAAASFLWGTAAVALFPGNFASDILIEKLFWNSGWTLTSMLAAEIPVLIAINAAIWFGVVRAMQWMFGRRSR
jgi:hypothetical protein